MKVSVKQLAKMLMEDKHVLATHPGAEENPDGIEKDLLSRSWGDDEEADPKLDYVDEARFAEIAGIQEAPYNMARAPGGNEMVDHAIFSSSAIYDLIEVEIQDYLNNLPGGAEGLARDEADRMELALTDAMKALIGDYVL